MSQSEQKGRVADPCTMVIYGAAGDLTKHGAIPAMERGLYSLQYCRMKTPGHA